MNLFSSEAKAEWPASDVLGLVNEFCRAAASYCPGPGLFLAGRLFYLNLVGSKGLARLALETERSPPLSFFLVNVYFGS